MNPSTGTCQKKPVRLLQSEDGQSLLMFVLFIIVLFVFIGLGVDMGFAYITRARLSKAVDAACLTGMRNLSEGQAQASIVASNAFLTNYGTSGRDVSPPSLSISFTNVSSGVAINVGATVSINTYFIRILPQWRTLTVGSSGQATRADVVMTLVLDRSGSMGSPPPGGSGGGQYLPNAVTTFINNFDDINDNVAMVSFSTVQQNVFYGGSPPQPTHPFKSTIISDVNAFTWGGSTFSQGGLTNGLVLENNASVSSSESVIKIVVFCTDGLANLVQGTLSCPPATVFNFGGQDSGNGVSFYDPSSGTTKCSLSDGGAPSCCSGVSQFQSAIDGSMQPFIRANVSADALYRAVQVSNQMRAAGIIVYAIGVGTGVDATFLAEVANDPSSPTYVATSYDGEYVLANDPSTLGPVFQTIASKILLRLSK